MNLRLSDRDGARIDGVMFRCPMKEFGTLDAWSAVRLCNSTRGPID